MVMATSSPAGSSRRPRRRDVADGGAAELHGEVLPDRTVADAVTLRRSGVVRIGGSIGRAVADRSTDRSGASRTSPYSAREPSRTLQRDREARLHRAARDV